MSGLSSEKRPPSFSDHPDHLWASKGMTTFVTMLTQFKVHVTPNQCSLSCYEGVLQEWYVEPLLEKDFYSNITVEVDNQWKSSHGGKNVRETIEEWLVKYLGEPITQMLR